MRFASKPHAFARTPLPAFSGSKRFRLQVNLANAIRQIESLRDRVVPREPRAFGEKCVPAPVAAEGGPLGPTRGERIENSPTRSGASRKAAGAADQEGGPLGPTSPSNSVGFAGRSCDAPKAWRSRHRKARRLSGDRPFPNAMKNRSFSSPFTTSASDTPPRRAAPSAAASPSADPPDRSRRTSRNPCPTR